MNQEENHRFLSLSNSYSLLYGLGNILVTPRYSELLLNADYSLFPYQKEVADWVSNSQRKIHLLAMRMGMGKTLCALQTMAVLLNRKGRRKNNRFTTLYVCPLSTIGTVRKEIQKFFSNSRVRVLEVSSRLGYRHYGIEHLSAENADIVITSYSTVTTRGKRGVRLSKVLFDRKWSFAIIDESHTLARGKVGSAQRRALAHRVRSEKFLLMTGTPILRDWRDIRTQLLSVSGHGLRLSKKCSKRDIAMLTPSVIRFFDYKPRFSIRVSTILPADVAPYLQSTSGKGLIIANVASRLAVQATQLTRFGIPFHFVHASLSYQERENVVEAFRSHQDNSALLIPLTYGRLGWNLGCADWVLFLDIPRDPTMAVQAIHRVCRVDRSRGDVCIRFQQRYGENESRLKELWSRLMNIPGVEINSQ